MKPTRINLSRQRGWKMPENTVKVDRATKWGNPFKVGDPGVGDADIAVRLYEEALIDGQLAVTLADVKALKGKHLACWCKQGDAACHADVLLRYANGALTHPWAMGRYTRNLQRMGGYQVVAINELPPMDVCERTLWTLCDAVKLMAQALDLELDFTMMRSVLRMHGMRRERIRNALTRVRIALDIAHAETGQPESELSLEIQRFIHSVNQHHQRKMP